MQKLLHTTGFKQWIVYLELTTERIIMEKLFYQDTRMIDFEAIVTECFEDEKKKGWQVVLNRTAFFPEEGGQTADKGTLNELEVLDVQIKDDIIYHLLAEPLEVGSTVTGYVDWNQRLDFMQQHSAEHILSGLLYRHYGFNNVGFHLSVNEVTMDFDGQLSWEQLREIETKANEIVWKDLPVQAYFPTKEELENMEYRSKIEIEGDVRIVEILGVDACACCAPHVSFTGEIGVIKIISAMNHRGGMRLTLLCGNRALKDYSFRQDTFSVLTSMLSAKPEKIIEAVKRLQDESLAMKNTANQLANQLMELKLASLPSPEEAENVLLFVELSNMVAVRNTVNDLTTRYSGYCAIFSGNDNDGYNYIVGSSNKDCREIATFLREKFAAKGGGTAPMVQGSVKANKEQLQMLFY